MDVLANRVGWFTAYCPVSEINLRLMMKRNGCKCPVWIPREPTADGPGDVLFPEYVFVSLPLPSAFPCGACSMPFTFLPDVERMRPLPVVRVLKMKALEFRGIRENRVAVAGEVVVLNDRAGAWSGLTGVLVCHVPATMLPLARVRVDLFGEEQRTITVPSGAVEVMA